MTLRPLQDHPNPHRLTLLARLLPWGVTRAWAIDGAAAFSVGVRRASSDGSESEDDRSARAWVIDGHSLVLEVAVRKRAWAFLSKLCLPTEIALRVGSHERWIVDGFEVDACRVDNRLLRAHNPHHPRLAVIHIGR